MAENEQDEELFPPRCRVCGADLRVYGYERWVRDYYVNDEGLAVEDDADYVDGPDEVEVVCSRNHNHPCGWNREWTHNGIQLMPDDNWQPPPAPIKPGTEVRFKYHYVPSYFPPPGTTGEVVQSTDWDVNVFVLYPYTDVHGHEHRWNAKQPDVHGLLMRLEIDDVEVVDAAQGGG